MTGLVINICRFSLSLSHIIKVHITVWSQFGHYCTFSRQALAKWPSVRLEGEGEVSKWLIVKSAQSIGWPKYWLPMKDFISKKLYKNMLFSVIEKKKKFPLDVWICFTVMFLLIMNNIFRRDFKGYFVGFNIIRVALSKGTFADHSS